MVLEKVQEAKHKVAGVMPSKEKEKEEKVAETASEVQYTV